MTNEELISWLINGDVSIQFQAYKDLLDTDKPALRKKIEREGWGAKFLSFRHPNGQWGKAFYQPKWTSTHYTLLDLKNLWIPPDNKAVKETLEIIFNQEKCTDGGIKPIGTLKKSDVCINGMVLNYASYFHVHESDLKSVVDCLLSQQMKDGGFNCQSNRKGATHSSLHSTLSVIEGIHEYQMNGYQYRIRELKKAETDSQEFILMHRLFRSDKTGEVIHPDFLKLHYPPRWHYDILRALDYFQSAGVKYDKRMDDAVQLIIKRRNTSGQWNLAAKYQGQTHFDMEESGKPSRWNTLRALRVLKHFRIA